MKILFLWERKIKPFLISLVYGTYPAGIKKCLKLFALLGLAAWSIHAFADNTDILQGTDSSAWSTLEGTGKKYLYLTEGIIGLAAYIKTKNLLALAGIVVVAIFINIIIKIGSGQ